jgi:Protein kinase domain
MADAIGASERPGANLRPGTLLADRYRIESIVGAGAFGVVWRARHVHLETECAVKLFDPPPGADPQDASARFLQEARVTARLRCPYVAQVFDYGVHERMPFLVLELLRGTSLAGRLRVLREHGRRMPPAETARVIRHVAEALLVAHAARVVHRDLKPENIFLVEERESHVAKVLDFGIAKWSADAAPGMTTTRTLMGTAHYMSPEQFESARQVDHRADLWSLGVIAFECLTGRVPFPGNSLIDVAFKVCKEGPLVASQLAPVPAGFDAWFARATALGREYRFASALEQAQALERVCSAAPAASARPESSSARPLVASVATTRTVVTTRVVALFRSAQSALSSITTRRQAWPAWTRAGDNLGSSGVPSSLRRRGLWLAGACVLGLTVAWGARFAGPEPGVPGLEEKTLSAQPSSPISDRPPASSGPREERRVPTPAPAVPSQHMAAPSPSGPGVNPISATGLEAPAPAAGSKLAPTGSSVAEGGRGTSVPSAVPPDPTREQRGEARGVTPAAAALRARAPKQEPAANATRFTARPPAAPVQLQEAQKALTQQVTDAAAASSALPPSAETEASRWKAARAALLEAAERAGSCTAAGGPTGGGHVQVTFEPSGSVAEVTLSDRFQNTKTGSCVQKMFGAAKMPKFTGAPRVVLNQIFEIK